MTPFYAGIINRTGTRFAVVEQDEYGRRTWRVFLSRQQAQTTGHVPANDYLVERRDHDGLRR